MEMVMSDDTASIRAELWEKMRKKPYRDNFVAAHLSANIAAQIQAIREARGWKKKELAEKTGMAPARISVMENPSYEKYALSTLRRLASTFDVALIVRFAPFSELVDWVAHLSPERMAVSNFEADCLKPRAVPQGVSMGMAMAERKIETRRNELLPTKEMLLFVSDQDIGGTMLAFPSSSAALPQTPISQARTNQPSTQYW